MASTLFIVLVRYERGRAGVAQTAVAGRQGRGLGGRRAHAGSCNRTVNTYQCQRVSYKGLFHAQTGCRRYLQSGLSYR